MEKPEVPLPSHELCYECDGERVCWSCRGAGRMSDGERCNSCTGRGRCIVCDGEGELPAGSHTRTGKPPRLTVTRVGCFEELGFEGGPSLADARGRRAPDSIEKVVAYLKSGPILVLSPGLVRDVFERSNVAGNRSLRTDGVYAWPDSLAYFVEKYAVQLPTELEAHMAARQWTMPPGIDVATLMVS